MLNLYSIFHLNLMYSSIEAEDRSKAIKKCYWPLLKLSSSLEIPLGIELTGRTLELINGIAPEWTNRLRELLKEKKVELVGSGYAQIVGPLVPAVVNDWNQKLGLKVYEKILGIRPQVALVNEMAYSAGIVEHYINNGYEAIIMEWNNPRRYHPEWENEWRYFSQQVTGADGKKIPIIWADSIAFQKFQRYAQGEMDLGNYIEYLQYHCNKEEIRYFPVYANDAEIFDFRPSRYSTEAEINKEGEWNRIAEFYDNIKRDSSFKLIKPSEVLSGLNDEMAGNELRLESPEQPIPVKKQEKYNINRWALTGRDDLNINTICYKIYNAFLKGNPNKENWKELCYLWSGDFRTHITSKRWSSYLDRLNSFREKWTVRYEISIQRNNQQIIKLPYRLKGFSLSEDKKFLTIETKTLKCSLNKFRGLVIDKLWFKNISSEPLLGTLPHGYYDDISLGADFYSGHCIIERPGEHKITDLLACKPEILYENKSLVIIRCEIFNRNVKFNKEYKIYFEKPYMEIASKITLPKRRLAIIHPMNITFVPTSFDKESLFYATHNGEKIIERFKIGHKVVYHAQSLSHLISAKHGLGATEGIIVVGDNKRRISIYHDQTKSALIPSVHYLPIDDDQYFLRLEYSAQEMDETFVKNRECQKLECRWKIMIYRNSIGGLV